MKILYLPGMSIRNKAETDNVSDKLTENGYEVIRHAWAHWDNSEIQWDQEKELLVINKKLEGLNEDEFIVIGKSIGSLLSLDVISNYSSRIKSAILMGLPIQNLDDGSGPERAEKYKTILSKVNFQVVIIQNENDPLGAFDYVKETLNLPGVKFVKMSASDHAYNYPEEVIENLSVD